MKGRIDAIENRMDITVVESASGPVSSRSSACSTLESARNRCPASNRASDSMNVRDPNFTSKSDSLDKNSSTIELRTDSLDIRSKIDSWSCDNSMNRATNRNFSVSLREDSSALKYAMIRPTNSTFASISFIVVEAHLTTNLFALWLMLVSSSRKSPINRLVSISRGKAGRRTQDSALTTIVRRRSLGDVLAAATYGLNSTRVNISATAS